MRSRWDGTGSVGRRADRSDTPGPPLSGWLSDQILFFFLFLKDCKSTVILYFYLRREAIGALQFGKNSNPKERLSS